MIERELFIESIETIRSQDKHDDECVDSIEKVFGNVLTL